MNNLILHTIGDEKLWLSAHRCIFWEQENILIVSDLHLGKTGHFRKEGIPVPQSVYKEDLQRLVSQLQHFKPGKLLIVGDLFHSRFNKELDLFKKWRADFSQLSIHLVKGNHDILHDDWYREAGITTSEDVLNIRSFSFRHDLQTVEEEQQPTMSYTFSGHIHPGISIRGLGKQSLRFPCFYFAERFCVLPAFGRFTGTYTVEPKKKETVFAIVENKIVQVQ
ncbi:MAG TPA: ligase-associated DNA damage response endonuclease PdeM [Chitinophagaceae bacterium]|jgi:DNA ligase-associated metallophosphoesterase|nr:ligase-associated DNA damage response endonuclease PdeM [Chitinophagaceae bacterium]